MQIITFETAKIAKEKGLPQNETMLYYSIDGKLCHFDYNNDKQGCAAITYHQLIDWVFVKEPDKDGNIVNKIGNTFLAIKRLEFWYNHLKDCHLKYEFKGRLLEWFRKNNYTLITYTDGFAITDETSDLRSELRMYNIDGNQKLVNVLNMTGFKMLLETSAIFEPVEYSSYNEAEHQGILEIFKLLKHENK